MKIKNIVGVLFSGGKRGKQSAPKPQTPLEKTELDFDKMVEEALKEINIEKIVKDTLKEMMED